MIIDKVVSFLSKNKIVNFLFKKIYYQFIRERISVYRNKKYLEHSEEILTQAKIALESENIFFWLEFGTLLGAYRDNDFIKHDSDIDLGLFLKDYSPRIDELMKKKGFKKVQEYQLDGGEYGLEQTYSYKGVYIDLFYFSEINNETLKTHCFANFNEIKALDKKDFFYEEKEIATIEIYMKNNGFEKKQFKKQWFNIPNNTKSYLSFHYGEDFMTPKHWDFMDLIVDHKNAKLINKRVKVVKA